MSTLIWHNGTFKDESEAVFTANDRIRLGDGVFDTMLVVITEDSPPLLPHYELHLSRILHNANLVGIGVEALLDIGELEKAALALITKNNLSPGHYALSTTISRGPSERGLAPPENPEPQIVMRLAPVPEEFPPIEAIIAETVRRNEGSPLSRIKSCNYGDNILALKEASEKGANEAIMLNNQGHVTCATIGNIFAVIDGGLMTPPLENGTMDGIARGLLIQRYDVLEQSFSADDLISAQGIYITNSLRGARAVVSLDGQAIPPPSIQIAKTFHLE